jgi:hypothetical protein
MKSANIYSAPESNEWHWAIGNPLDGAILVTKRELTNFDTPPAIGQRILFGYDAIGGGLQILIGCFNGTLKTAAFGRQPIGWFDATGLYQIWWNMPEPIISGAVYPMDHPIVHHSIKYLINGRIGKYADDMHIVLPNGDGVYRNNAHEWLEGLTQEDIDFFIAWELDEVPDDDPTVQRLVKEAAAHRIGARVMGIEPTPHLRDVGLACGGLATTLDMLTAHAPIMGNNDFYNICFGKFTKRLARLAANCF